MRAEQGAFERAAVIKEKVKDELLSRANVIGVGIGFKQVEGQKTNQVALVVLVTRKVPAASLARRDRLPLEIEGVPVDVQEIGEVRAQGGSGC